MNNLVPKLRAEESKLLTRVMTMGAGTSLPVVMTSTELAKLIGVIYSDTEKLDALGDSFADIKMGITPPSDNYYKIPSEWFHEHIPLSVDGHVALIRAGVQQIEDFTTYLECLTELHKRRLKYAMILSAQPMPTMVQVSPRSLVEFGTKDTQALASWLTWRKFFYDLDNRAAQETGYLFEPILAAALGGERKSANSKVVTRTGDETRGRQVDCWKVLADGTKLAYEFKLRVTIAASGQGRFAEEIQFAEDAQNSGARPILVVLDPTMNSRLDELQAAFRAKGGDAFLGDAAWEHLEAEAGEVMSRFIEKYVHQPIQEVSAFEESEKADGKKLSLLELRASYSTSTLTLELGEHVRSIPRRESKVLEVGKGEDEPES